MQNIRRLILFSTLILMIFGCTDKSEGPAIISINREKGMPDKIFLYKPDNGELKEIASTTEVDSVFYFAYKPAKEGIYYLGLNKLNKSFANRYAFYLKVGDKLDYTITENSYKLKGNNNSKENKEMEKWHNFIQPLELKSNNYIKDKTAYKDVLTLLEENFSAMRNYPKTATGNTNFDCKFEVYKYLNFLDVVTSYFFVAYALNPNEKNFPNDLCTLNIADFTKTTDLLNYPSGIDLIERINFIKNLCEEKNINKKTALIEVVNSIQNDTIKGEYAVKSISSCRSYSEIMDFMEVVGKYIITEKQKTTVKDIISSHVVVKEGYPAFDFKFADLNGKEIALSDFKGKVVYIDIWATWCGPCTQAIPYMKKLEEEYRNNKDIVFMSVSVDASKDIQKWKDFIAKEEMKGVQLFAGDKAKRELLEPYKISGIPRFMIVGKNGNIVALDAPRPFAPEINGILKSLLK